MNRTIWILNLRRNLSRSASLVCDEVGVGQARVLSRFSDPAHRKRTDPMRVSSTEDGDRAGNTSKMAVCRCP